MTSRSCTLFDFEQNPSGVVDVDYEENVNYNDSDSDNESPDLPIMAEQADQDITQSCLITEQLQELEDVSKLPISAGAATCIKLAI